MMVFTILYTLLVLSFLAGKVASQSFTDDYTLSNPVYTATVNNGLMVFTGTYATTQLHTVDVYTQVFKTVVNNACTDTSVTANSSPVTVTSSTVAAAFSLPVASLTTPVYTESTQGTATIGTVLLCHRLEIRKNTLLVNVVDTIVTATVNLTANFVSVSIVTTATTTGTAGAGQVDLGSTVTATASPSGAISAGKPITITVTSLSYNIASIKANFKDGYSVIPMAGGAPMLVSTPVCTNSVSEKKCVFTLNLGIDFFRPGGAATTGPGTYVLQGTATLVLANGTRRQLQDDEAEAPFSLVFYEATDDAASSAVGVTGSIRMCTMAMAAGGLVATMVAV